MIASNSSSSAFRHRRTGLISLIKQNIVRGPWKKQIDIIPWNNGGGVWDKYVKYK